MIDWIIWAGISIGSAIYDRQKANRERTKSLAEANKRLPGVDQIQFPVVTESDPMPVLFGTHWLRSPNVLWYGFLKAQPWPGDNDANVVPYTGAMLLSFCAGPIDKVLRITADEVLVSDTSYDLTSGPFQIIVQKDQIWGDPFKGGNGGLAGVFSMLPGLPNQDIPALFSQDLVDANGNPINDLRDSLNNPIMPAFRGIFTVLLGDYLAPGVQPTYRPDVTSGSLQISWPQDSINRFYFGHSPVFKPIEILGQRLTQRGFGDAQWYPSTVEINLTEMNPAHIIHELLTDPVYGYGIGSNEIDDSINAPVSTFQNAANIMASDTLGLSFVWGQQQTRLDAIKEVLRHIGAFLVRNPKTGKYELRMLRDDYTVSNLPVLGPAQIEQVIRYTRPDMSLLPTILEAKYMDRDTNTERVVRQDDQSGLLTRGEIREEVYYQLVARGDIAARIATNHMLEASAPLAVVELSIPYCAGCDFLPGDVFVWQWPDYGIQQMVLRVLSVTRGMLEDGNVRLRCKEDAYAFRETLYAPPPITAWVDPVLPPLNAAVLGFELPLGLWLAGVRQNSPWVRVDDFASDERGVAALVAARPNDAHVSYDLWSEGLSNLPRLVDTGAEWSSQIRVDGIVKPTTFGVDGSAATATLRLKATSFVPEIGSVILFTIGGSGKQPQEIVYVTDVNYVSTAWEIDIERALFDTDELFSISTSDGSVTDPVGAMMGYLLDIDDPLQIQRAYSIDVPKDLVTSSGNSFLRAITSTSRGILPFSSATPITVNIEGRPFAPIPPYIYDITDTGTATLIEWHHRNRNVDRLVFTNESVPAEAGVDYTLSIYEVEPTFGLLRNVTGLNGTDDDYTYSHADEDSDRGGGGLADVLRFEIEAERGTKQSYYVFKKLYRRVPI
jgi:hypothetical protein